MIALVYIIENMCYFLIVIKKIIGGFKVVTNKKMKIITAIVTGVVLSTVFVSPAMLITASAQTTRSSVSKSSQSTTIKRLTPKQVQKAVNSGDGPGYVVSNIPGFGAIFGFASYVQTQRFKTAARNGWGLKYVITVDPYNPTSTGMKFSWEYVK